MINKSVWISAIISGIVTWIFIYLDAKLFDDPKNKSTYFKGIMYVSAVVAMTVYFLTGNTPQLGGSSMTMNSSIPTMSNIGMTEGFQGGLAPF
uniref:Uncharacterized protein n=1 Tax=viral metagenome TaxID=1070528 RepID=A0A6C0J449_9ZZZZ